MNVSSWSDSLQEFLRSRRSVRRFYPESVSDAILERVLETATWSPSAHNRQPWRFVVLTGQDVKIRLADEMGAGFRRDLLADGVDAVAAQRLVDRSRARIQSAPVVVLLCLDTSELDHYPDAARQRAEEVMGIQSVALAGGTLLLAVHAEGLAGVWICAPLFASAIVQQTLDLPVNWQPQGMLLIGHPEAVPEPRPRKSLGEVVRFVR